LGIEALCENALDVMVMVMLFSSAWADAPNTNADVSTAPSPVSSRMRL
jgi:hypothetical protein